MKTWAFSILVTLSSFNALAIVVFDPTAASQRTTHQAAQIVEMGKQLMQMIDQYKRLGEQLDAITRTRDLKALLGLRDIQTLIDPAAFAALKQLESTGVSDVTVVNNKRLHQQSIQTAQAIEARKAELDKLLNAASTTTDAKAAADLTARAVAQNALLLNEMLYQMELQKAAVAKTILDEQKLRDERYAQLTSGRANPFKPKRP